jgi:FKBP-type peptidyl-prolyl cis-trans isomerase SlyD
MTVSKHKVVTLTYQLRNSEGVMVDEATESHPFAFIHEMGMTLEDFDKNLSGLSAGEEFNFTLSPEQGYGDMNEEAIVPIPMSIFAGEDLPENLLTPGNVVPMQDNQGNPLNGKVVSVDETQVIMDFNHPLAGSNLHFTGRIVSVREATPQELEHGHVHHDGHDH